LARKLGVPESAIQTWLSLKQRKALLSARLYFTMTLLGGITVLLPNLAILYLVDKTLLWVIAPFGSLSGTPGFAPRCALCVAAVCRQCPRRTR
jgi:hypothetical protein